MKRSSLRVILIGYTDHAPGASREGRHLNILRDWNCCYFLRKHCLFNVQVKGKFLQVLQESQDQGTTACQPPRPQGQGWEEGKKKQTCYSPTTATPYLLKKWEDWRCLVPHLCIPVLLVHAVPFQICLQETKHISSDTLPASNASHSTHGGDTTESACPSTHCPHCNPHCVGGGWWWGVLSGKSLSLPWERRPAPLLPPFRSHRSSALKGNGASHRGF